jgi:hypothetical protein
MQTLLLRRGLRYFSYRPRGEDAEFYSMMIAESVDRFDGELTGIGQVDELIANYRVRSRSLTSASLVPASHPPEDSCWKHAQDEARKRRIPRFLSDSTVPERYLSRAAVGRWIAQRRLREANREISRGNFGASIRLVRGALRDDRIDLVCFGSTVIRLVKFLTDRLLSGVRRTWFTALRGSRS